MKDEYLEKLIAEAAPQMAKITDPEAWLSEVRGYDPPRRKVITIEPPRRDWRGNPMPDRFLAPVRVEVRWPVFYIDGKMFYMRDGQIEHIIETVKMLEK